MAKLTDALSSLVTAGNAASQETKQFVDVMERMREDAIRESHNSVSDESVHNFMDATLMSYEAAREHLETVYFNDLTRGNFDRYAT